MPLLLDHYAAAVFAVTKSIKTPRRHRYFRSPTLIGEGTFFVRYKRLKCGMLNPRNSAACSVFRRRSRLKSEGMFASEFMLLTSFTGDQERSGVMGTDLQCVRNIGNICEIAESRYFGIWRICWDFCIRPSSLLEVFQALTRKPVSRSEKKRPVRSSRVAFLSFRSNLSTVDEFAYLLSRASILLTGLCILRLLGIAAFWFFAQA